MISKNTLYKIAFVVLALALMQFSLAQAVTVTANRISDYEVEFCFDVGTGEVVKDFHFEQGALVDADGGNIGLTGAPTGWVVDVANGNVNVYANGNDALTEDDITCIAVDITAVGSSKRFSDMPTAMVLTNDGDADIATGVVDTSHYAGRLVTAETIPTLSEWGLIIFALLILTLVTVVVTRRRRAMARAGA